MKTKITWSERSDHGCHMEEASRGTAKTLLSGFEKLRNKDAHLFYTSSHLSKQASGL